MAKSRGYTRRRPSSDARARAWTSMRVLRHFTLPQVQMTAGISEGNLFVFVRRLARAGYLWVIKERVINRPGSRAVYRLVRNTGPLQPIPQRSGVVYDPNVREVYGLSKSDLTRNEIDRRPAPTSEQSRLATTNTESRATQTIGRSHTVEFEARRAAKRVGLVANKARGRRSDYNQGGFALIDPVEGRIVVGRKFDLTAEDVIEHCRQLEQDMDKPALSQDDLEFLEDLKRCTPEQRCYLRRIAIRMLTKQINTRE